MRVKYIEIELLLFEEDPESYELSAKGKIARVMRLSNQDVKTWYASERINERVSVEDWSEFKLKLVRYCKVEPIESQKKFREENWDDYVKKPKNWSVIRGLAEKLVIDS